MARHANASQVRVDLTQEHDRLRLRVVDDGAGISDEQLSDPKAFGLIGMRERAFVWGGEIHIAGVPKEGTTVEVSIPMAALGDQEAPKE